MQLESMKLAGVALAEPPPEERKAVSAAVGWPEEDGCQLYSKRGLELSCNVHPLEPKSDVDYLKHSVEYWAKLTMSHYPEAIRKHGDGASVYVTTSALPVFVQDVLPYVNTTFKLVTGDAIKSPVAALSQAGFEKLVNDRRVVRWFAQNCADGEDTHPKVVPIPLGLDYHTLKKQGTYWGPQASPQDQEDSLLSTGRGAPPFYERSSYIYYCGSSSSPLRKTIADQLRSQWPLVQTDPVGMSRQAFWDRTAKHKFVASPPGAGKDCHRTWEILALGGIPLVDRTLRRLYEENGFNVVLMGDEDWGKLKGAVVQERMRQALARHSDTLPPSMYLKYWVDKVSASYAPVWMP